MPCGLSSKAELTKGGVLIIICFVFTSHASPSGYFLSISGVWSMLECWKSSLFAETSHWRHLPAWEYMQWYCKKPKSLFSLLKWSITTATAGEVELVTVVALPQCAEGKQNSTTLQDGIGTHCPRSCVSSAQGLRKW